MMKRRHCPRRHPHDQGCWVAGSNKAKRNYAVITCRMQAAGDEGSLGAAHPGRLEGTCCVECRYMSGTAHPSAPHKCCALQAIQDAALGRPASYATVDGAVPTAAAIMHIYIYIYIYTYM